MDHPDIFFYSCTIIEPKDFFIAEAMFGIAKDRNISRASREVTINARGKIAATTKDLS